MRSSHAVDDALTRVYYIYITRAYIYNYIRIEVGITWIDMRSSHAVDDALTRVYYIYI